MKGIAAIQPKISEKDLKPRQSREQSRISGTVKWFNAKNGYGFITFHENNEDDFVYFSAISKNNPIHSMTSLGDGELVEFNIMAIDMTGPCRKNLKGNPYGSHIPIRRYDILAAGDPGMMLTVHHNKYIPHDYGNSRIPRWKHFYRN